MQKEKMDKIIKKVACINDISCLGGASITEIIPILSAMGIRACPVPTVVLSTHSGGYENYTYKDLTSHMVEQGIHWKELDVKFDAIYSGFLGSAQQVVIVEDFIDTFKSSTTKVVIDPVMGDDGVLYSSIDANLVEEIKKLVVRANIITPNLTEAYFLSDMKYKEVPSDKDIKNLIDKMLLLGPDSIVITSVPRPNGLLATIVYENGQQLEILTEKITADFPGTGDIFASILVGALLNDQNLIEATKIASTFVKNAIAFSYKENYSHRSGVLLEACLPELYKFNKFNK